VNLQKQQQPEKQQMLRELQQQQVAIQPQQVQQQFLAHSLAQLMDQGEPQVAHQREQQDQMMVHEVSLTSQAQQVREDHHLQVAHHPQVAHQPQPAVKVAQQVDYLDSLVQHQR
jgi:hypothetical protein